MKEQIRQLIADGKTDEALTLLAQINTDTILLQARYNNGRKQYNMGLIDFSEWQRIQSQVNYAALEMAGQDKTVRVKANDGDVSISVNPSGTREGIAANKPTSVFISYNHLDKAFAQKIQEYLAGKGVSVAIDFQNMVVGQSIEGFILEQVKHNKSVLSLVSKNSLRSGWVGLESNLALYNRLLNDIRFIPVMVDNEVFNGDFFFEIIDEIDEKIRDLDLKIDKSRERKIGYSQFEAQRKRLEEQRNNLDDIIAHFQSVLIADISDGNFETGMQQVFKAIQDLKS